MCISMPIISMYLPAQYAVSLDIIMWIRILYYRYIWLIVVNWRSRLRFRVGIRFRFRFRLGFHMTFSLRLLAHVVMSLCNHALSIMCHCCCQHLHNLHLCAAIPVTALIIQTSYFTDISICGIWQNSGYSTCYFKLFCMLCTPWCDVSGDVYHLMQCCDATSNYDITYEHPWCHLWCHHYIIGTAYIKVLHGTYWGSVNFGSSLLRWGTHACRDWWTDTPAFLEPTSFKDNWLGCCLLLPWASTLCQCLYTFWRHTVSAAILSPSTISAGPLYLWLVPVCTIFIVLIGLHLRKHLATGVAPFCLVSCTSQFLASLGGHQLNTSGPNHGPCSTLVATQVFKCSYDKREMSITALYLEG